MRKISIGTIQRRRDGMMIETGEVSVYIPMGHDGWCPPAGTHMRVILEPVVAVTERVEKEAGGRRCRCLRRN